MARAKARAAAAHASHSESDYHSSWVLLWSDIFTFSSKSRDLKSIKKMMVFSAKKLLLDREIAGLQFNIFKDQSNAQLGELNRIFLDL